MIHLSVEGVLLCRTNMVIKFHCNITCNTLVLNYTRVCHAKNVGQIDQAINESCALLQVEAILLQDSDQIYCSMTSYT